MSLQWIRNISLNVSTRKSCFKYRHVLECLSTGFRIWYRIHWPPTDRHHEQLQQSHWTTHSNYHCNHRSHKSPLSSPQSSLMLRPTVSRPVCLGIKHITVRQMRVCWCGALCLTRGRVCRLLLLLALASTVILASESRGSRDLILLSQIRDFPFRRLLRLAGLRWRYSTPPPHGIDSCEAATRQQLLYICLSSGRLPATGLHATTHTQFNKYSIL
jgi:hypothetical protein